jgi:DNA-binding NarL/FixJ family response regulator
VCLTKKQPAKGTAWSGYGCRRFCVSKRLARNLPTTPIVMYTLHKDEQLESIARSAGVCRVVAKEEGVQELLGAIDAEVPRHEI